MRHRPSFTSRIGRIGAAGKTAAALLSLSGLLLMLSSGCAQQKPRSETVLENTGRPPLRAISVDYGSGRRSWLADEDGKFYIYDVSADAIVFQSNVHRGDRIVVDPAKNSITENDRPVASKAWLDPNHIYQIFFLDSQSAP